MWRDWHSNLGHDTQEYSDKNLPSLLRIPQPLSWCRRSLFPLTVGVGTGARRQGSAHVAESHRLVHDDPEGPDVGLAVVPDGGPRGSVGPEGGISVRGRNPVQSRSGAWARTSGATDFRRPSGETVRTVTVRVRLRSGLEIRRSRLQGVCVKDAWERGHELVMFQSTSVAAVLRRFLRSSG